MGQEFCQILGHAEQALNPSNVSGTRHFCDCSNFCRVSLEALVCCHMSDKWHFTFSQPHFAVVEFNTPVGTSTEESVRVLVMVLDGFVQCVAEPNHHKIIRHHFHPPQPLCKLVDVSLEDLRRQRDSKWYALLSEPAKGCVESGQE